MDNKLTKSDIKKILKMTFKYDPETVNTYLQNPQNADEEYREHDIKFCDRAEFMLKNGYKVIYTSWW